MSSMSKVMQKIEEEAAQQAAQGADAPQDADGATAADQSAFVAEGEAAAGAMFSEAPFASDELDDTTVEWDAGRVDPVVVAFHDRYSAICEQYRAVRARLLTMNPTGEPQIIAITSSIPEEGKSVSTLNLGVLMGEGGEHRILMVDGDFRRTSLARMVGVTSSPGMADFIQGTCELKDILQPTPLPNVKLLPAGEVQGRAYSDLLAGQRLPAALERLRAVFDYVFVDTPPVTTVSDVCLLAPHCDGAIMVVEMRRTPEPTVQQAVRTLQANNVKVMGCLLSRFRDRGAGYYENYYYSSYYYKNR